MNPIIVGSVYSTALPDVCMGGTTVVYGSISAIVACAGAGLAVLLTFVYLVTQRAARERTRRLEVLAEALRRPDLDPAVRNECLRALRPPDSGTKWLFATGWLGLGASICWVCNEPRGKEFTMAIMAIVMSFAILTLPLAWREATRARTPA